MSMKYRQHYANVSYRCALLSFTYKQTESMRLKFIDYQWKYATVIPQTPARSSDAYKSIRTLNGTRSMRG